MKLKFKILILSLAMVFVFGAALPAKAFYLDVPDFFVRALQSLKVNALLAQEASIMEDPMNGMLAPADQPMMQMQPQDTRNISNEPVFQPNQPMQPNQPVQGDMKPMDQNMNPQGGDNARYLKDMQRGAKQMERQVKQLESQVLKAEKSGIAVDNTLKEKISNVKTMIECVKAAADETAIQSCNADDMGGLMQELEEQRREVLEAAQRLQQIKKEIRNMESQIKSFERQLVKAKNCVTEEITVKLATLKQTVATIKNAKTWAEVEDAGLENIGEIFSDINDSRQTLEMCARWPQTEKQVNKEITNLERQLKKSKTTVARLLKKSIDLSATYSAFESAVAKLKATRDEAKSLLQGGDAEGAMSLLQDDFFGQMEDVWQNQKIIDMMNNLGQFNSQFKRGLAQVNKEITALSRKKIDVTELKEILAQTKEKGNEVLAAIKMVKDDPDAVLGLLEDLEDLRMEFDAKRAELTGGEADMPWETGVQQIKQMELSKGLQSYQTCNINGVEMPGSCSSYGGQSMNPMGESNPQPSPGPTMAPDTYQTNPMGESNPQPSP